MTVKDKCIITAALSGVAAGRDQCPAIPYTPEEYALEAKRAADAGASVVHLHARYADGTPSYRVDEYRAIRDAIQAVAPELIINFSTGAVHIPKEERIAHIVELRPEIGALNMGSMTYAKYSTKRKEFVFDFVFENRFETILFFLEKMNEAGVKPECECFDTGHVYNAVPLIDMGVLRPPVQFSLILGVLGGAPAEPRTLEHMASLVPQPATWEVIGISRKQWTLVEAAASLGGNIRVGLEDNFYLPDGQMASSNGDLVAAAAKIAVDAGRQIADPVESRTMLSLAEAV
ncbi:MAG TPA: 3-keto-5-aminohexanoate cleavage protein [Actinomycetota bacterium]|nr:3-keto-5-aminohexanoate cleavage protein [Actinomycetota bacterium]